jgi:hypothetical protein
MVTRYRVGLTGEVRAVMWHYASGDLSREESDDAETHPGS